jgi:hypothetical protein
MIMLLIGLNFRALACAQNSAKNHPLVPRFKGSEVQEFKVSEFDEFPLALGPIVSKDNYTKAQRLEGKGDQIQVQHTGQPRARDSQ